MLIRHISVVIMARNAEMTIDQCLLNLGDFEEVILYLNESTDKTKEIAKKFSNVKIILGDFVGFGTTKNNAALHAKNDWILSLDSDEILNENIVNEITLQNFENIDTLFQLNRDNYFLGKKTRSKDVIVRLYNRKSTVFNENSVHEKIVVSPKHNVLLLKNSFKHLNIININQTLSKMMQYTDLGAADNKTCWFIIVIAKAYFAFVRTYFLKLYFLLGWRGYVIAKTKSNRRFYKYLKQYINCKDNV